MLTSERVVERNLSFAQDVRAAIDSLKDGFIGSFGTFRNRLEYEESIIERELRDAGISKEQYKEWHDEYLKSFR